MKRVVRAALRRIPSRRRVAYFFGFSDRLFVEREPRGRLFILFSGMSGGMSGVSTVRVKDAVLQEFPDASVVIKNLDYEAWNTVQGFHHWDITQMLRWVRSARDRYSSVYLIGASAGGFASILVGAASGVAGVLTDQAQTERSHRPQALDPRYSDVIGFIDGQVPLWLYFDPEGVKEHSSAQAHRIAHLPLVIARQMQPRTFSQLLDEGVFSQHLHEMVPS